MFIKLLFLPAAVIGPDGGSAGGSAGEQGVRSTVSGSEPAAAAGSGHRQIQPQGAAEAAGRGEVGGLRTGRAVPRTGE